MKKTNRFTPSRLSRFLVPALMIFILLGLVATLIVVGLSMAGLTPSL